MPRKTAKPKKGKAKAKKMPPANPNSERLRIPSRQVVGTDTQADEPTVTAAPTKSSAAPPRPAAAPIAPPSARKIVITPITDHPIMDTKKPVAPKPASVAKPVAAKPVAAAAPVTKAATAPAPIPPPAPTPPEPATPQSPPADIPPAPTDQPADLPVDDTDDDTATPGHGKPNAQTQQAIKAAEAEAKREQELQEYIESRQFYVPINAVARKRSIIVSASLTILILLLALVLVDLMLDSGIILLLQKIPHTHFFSLNG